MTATFKANGLVTLASDFGTSDAYVGAMKGVMLSVDATLRLHDIAHDISPQDLTHAAMVCRGAAPWFPPGTVHLGVIDPGVGTSRSPVVLVAGEHAFVGPDNGLFMPVADELGGVSGCWILDPAGPLSKWLPGELTSTFHGRDLFAPAAAAIASGALRPEELGPSHTPIVLAEARPEPGDGGLMGQITTCDRFGNAITNIGRGDLRPGEVFVRLPDGRRLELRATYGDVGQGEALALFGSEGLLEVAVRDGSAEKELGLGPGAAIRVERA